MFGKDDVIQDITLCFFTQNMGGVHAPLPLTAYPPELKESLVYKTTKIFVLSKNTFWSKFGSGGFHYF